MQNELGHTVLHGQHIFQRRVSKAPVPSSPRAMKQPPPPPIPQAHVRPLLARPIRGYAAPTAAVKQRHEVMAQKKERVQALVQKQRADAALRNAEAKVALERKARLLAAKKLNDKKAGAALSRLVVKDA